MFFRKKIKPQFMITIPEPCSEDWNKMRVVDEQHRHCDSCAKTLTDFTGMSDDELMLFFKYNNKKLCGRFKKDQLNRSMTPVHEEVHRHTWWKAAALIPLTLTAKSAFGQSHDSVPLTDTVQIAQQDSTVVDSIPVAEIAVDSLSPEPDTVAHEPKKEAKEAVIVYTIEMGDVMGNFGPLPEQEVYGGLNFPIYPHVIPRLYSPWDQKLWLINPFRKPVPSAIKETIDGNITGEDPAETKKEPDQPLKPASPWYEAILPASIRVRRKA